MFATRSEAHCLDVRAFGWHRQIRRYENGIIAPSVDVVIRLAELFDVTTDYLLIGSPRRPVRPVHERGRRVAADHHRRVVQVLEFRLRGLRDRVGDRQLGVGRAAPLRVAVVIVGIQTTQPFGAVAACAGCVGVSSDSARATAATTARPQRTGTWRRSEVEAAGIDRPPETDTDEPSEREDTEHERGNRDLGNDCSPAGHAATTQTST